MSLSPTPEQTAHVQPPIAQRMHSHRDETFPPSPSPSPPRAFSGLRLDHHGGGHVDRRRHERLAPPRPRTKQGADENDSFWAALGIDMATLDQKLGSIENYSINVDLVETKVNVTKEDE